MSTFHDIGVKDQSSQAEKTFINGVTPMLRAVTGLGYRRESGGTRLFAR
jgi:hypothetical protein